MGFITRGCPRSCPFCIVSKKEGRKVRRVAELAEFYKGQPVITLLDANITASQECERIFDELIETGAQIDFSQGLDVRLLTDKGAAQLNKMRLKRLHFAWDNYEMQTYEKLKATRPLLEYEERRLRVYVLTNYNTTLEQDLERVYKLRELGFDPYVMIYDKPKAPREIRRLQRWVNNKFVWYKVERFEDYKA